MNVDDKPQGASTPRLILLMSVSAIAGMLLVSFLWESVNLILSARISAPRLLATAGVLGVFLLLLRWLAGVLRRWEGVA